MSGTICQDPDVRIQTPALVLLPGVPQNLLDIVLDAVWFDPDDRSGAVGGLPVALDGEGGGRRLVHIGGRAEPVQLPEPRHRVEARLEEAEHEGGLLLVVRPGVDHAEPVLAELHQGAHVLHLEGSVQEDAQVRCLGLFFGSFVLTGVGGQDQVPGVDRRTLQSTWNTLHNTWSTQYLEYTTQYLEYTVPVVHSTWSTQEDWIYPPELGSP